MAIGGKDAADIVSNILNNLMKNFLMSKVQVYEMGNQLKNLLKTCHNASYPLCKYILYIFLNFKAHFYPNSCIGQHIFKLWD